MLHHGSSRTTELRYDHNPHAKAIEASSPLASSLDFNQVNISMKEELGPSMIYCKKGDLSHIGNTRKRWKPTWTIVSLPPSQWEHEPSSIMYIQTLLARAPVQKRYKVAIYFFFFWGEGGVCSKWPPRIFIFTSKLLSPSLKMTKPTEPIFGFGRAAYIRCWPPILRILRFAFSKRDLMDQTHLLSLSVQSPYIPFTICIQQAWDS